MHNITRVNHGIRVKGVDSTVGLMVKYIGLNDVFGVVLFNEDVQFNLVSLAQLTRDGFKVWYDHEKCSFYINNEKACVATMVFKLSMSGLYLFELEALASNMETMLVTFVNGKNRKRLDEVLELHKSLGHIGWLSLRSGLNGSILSHLQPSDVDNWLDSILICNGCVMSKAQEASSKVSINPDSSMIGEVLHCDIMYESGLTYLITVEESCNHVSVKVLSRMDHGSIADALEQIIKWYKSYRHDVKKLFSDEGSNLSAAVNCHDLNISHYPNGVNRHSK